MTSQPTNLRHGQAMAMQYVAFLLQKLTLPEGRPALERLLRGVTDAGGGSPLRVAALGCTWVMHVAAPLGVELALKALLQSDGRDCWGHDLVALYDKLPDPVRDRVEAEYRSLNEGMLRELLVVHKDDFVKWRYLDKWPLPSASAVRDLQFAICAVLNVYNSGQKGV
ncbi:MAG: hypothetical protein OXI15_22255 [Chromatiales bacterium]|nr:hypothetical protein [Chromatiales bacterium]